ncbi:MAG: CpsD/CapB family tyrosine-protein kinase, partial [Bacteroidota bacterium]
AQRKNITNTEISTWNEEINTLQNTVADVVRNSRKKVALEQDKINNTYTTSYPGVLVAKANESNLSVLNQKLFLTEKLYNYIADKKTETEGSMPLTEGSFIQKATLPRESSNANATVVWILAIIFGLLTGSIAAFIMGMLLKSFRQPASAAQNESSIARIANIENENKKNLSTQFKNLCTKMLLQREAGEKQIITVTSDSSGQGKTFIATHLAKSFAALDLNVLVLDMNFANPSIEENFETQTSYTLADVLQKQVGIQEAVQITSIPGLDILTAGNFVNGINSLIATNSMNKILNELKGHYDFIIIDAADTTNSLDAMPCMKFSNLTLFVSNLKSDEQDISNRVSQIKADYHIENIHLVSNNIKLSKKQKPSKAVIRNLDSVPKTPFLKKVALWFY